VIAGVACLVAALLALLLKAPSHKERFFPRESNTPRRLPERHRRLFLRLAFPSSAQ
jgi:hypothetical protein